jgi:tetratricopeptide (TPR) repeat protein
MTLKFSHGLIGPLFFALAFWQPGSGQTPFRESVDGQIRRCMDYNFACCFDSALAEAAAIENALPDESIGFVCRAGIYQSMMIEYSSDRWEKEFYQSVEKAVEKGESRIRENRDLPWNWYCLGSVYLYKGLYKGKTGGLVSGFINAHKGVEYLEKSYAADTTLYDALAGIGSYKYWAGRFYRHISWLPWVRDEREKGIQMVETAIRKGAFSYYAGLNSLGWIEYDRDRCDSGLALFRRGLEKYPESRLFIWGEADCLFRLGRMDAAAVVYEKLLVSIRLDSIWNPVNEIECRVKLAVAYEKLGNAGRALEHSNAVLLLKIDSKTAKRTEKQRQTALAIKIKCAERK